MDDALLTAYIDGVWVALPTPKQGDYSTRYEHLENSGVNAKGYLVRDIVRRNRAKVFCGWDLLDSNQMILLQSLYNLDDFLLRFTDNYNNRVTLTMYAGPLEGKAAKLNTEDLTIKFRTQVQMNFIEV